MSDLQIVAGGCFTHAVDVELENYLLSLLTVPKLSVGCIPTASGDAELKKPGVLYLHVTDIAEQTGQSQIDRVYRTACAYRSWRVVLAV